jgi:hypothetical protein
VEGICFFRSDGTRIDNFPMQHSDNCTEKHKDTRNWFKHTVRVYKNLRNTMIEKKSIQDGLAPSYFLEGLLYQCSCRAVRRHGAAEFQGYARLAECERPQQISVRQRDVLPLPSHVTGDLEGRELLEVSCGRDGLLEQAVDEEGRCEPGFGAARRPSVLQCSRQDCGLNLSISAIKFAFAEGARDYERSSEIFAKFLVDL